MQQRRRTMARGRDPQHALLRCRDADRVQLGSFGRSDPRGADDNPLADLENVASGDCCRETAASDSVISTCARGKWRKHS